jgi:hypothetical protein
LSANKAAHRLQILQESPAPQVFSSITHSTRDACAMSTHGAGTVEKCSARTLSREFWQQKNFHAHRLCVSSSLAKTGFLSESRAADSGVEAFVARANFAIYGERSVHARMRGARGDPPASPLSDFRCRVWI